MNFSEAKIMIGDKIYTASSVDWVQTPNTWPEITVNTTISPYNEETIGVSTRYGRTPTRTKPLTITNVIFNPPATIVFWSDKTKTVVKCDFDQEPYDPEKGLAMAISKKMLGDNKYEYYNTFLHWLKKWNRQKEETRDVLKKDDVCGFLNEMYGM